RPVRHRLAYAGNAADIRLSGHNRLQCRSQAGHGHVGRRPPPARQPPAHHAERGRHLGARRALARHHSNHLEPRMSKTEVPEELAKFGRLADRWWDTEGEMRPLHDINPLRLDYIDQRAPLDGAHVLDVGCGAGILSEAMARRGATVTG